MIKLIGVDGLDLVDVEVELRGLSRDAGGNALQLGMAAPYDRARTSAFRWAIVLTKTSFVIAS